MAEVVLFGATGHTGSLCAHALGRRGASFAVAGRSAGRLERIAEASGAAAVRVADARDPGAVQRAARGAGAIVACVGPFVLLGDAAVEAALRTGAHYVDSSGEASHVARLVARRDADARDAGIVMAPAMGFDEVPADVAATLATSGMEAAELDLTYALPSQATPGTVRSSIGVLADPGTWLVRGEQVPVVTGDRVRWCPLPPPLGPRPSLSGHLAERHLAPLHLPVTTVRTHLTVGTLRRHALRAGLPALRRAASSARGRRAAEALLMRAVDRPTPGRARRARWTVVAEARASAARRNVVLSGVDVYGLTAELLALAAVELVRGNGAHPGVVAPVEAVGLDPLRAELSRQGVVVDVYEPR